MKTPKSNQLPDPRPRLLKDFLSLDSNPNPNPNPGSASSTKVSSFLTAAAAILRRKLLPKSRRETGRPQIQLRSPTIKDIIRWKSFRDLEDCEQNTTTTTTSSATSSPAGGSSGSSWCGSESTAEYLPWWMDGNLEEKGKKCLPRVGEGTRTKPDVGPESPISVMENVFEEDYCWSSSRDEHYITVECTGKEKWMSYREMKDIEVEERAWRIFTRILKNQANNAFNESEKMLVYDFIKQELTVNEVFDGEDIIMRRVNEWMNGEDKLWIGWDKKEACIREMDENGKWNKFEEENEEMGVQIEVAMVNLLLDELLLDIITCSYNHN